MSKYRIFIYGSNEDPGNYTKHTNVTMLEIRTEVPTYLLGHSLVVNMLLLLAFMTLLFA